MLACRSDIGQLAIRRQRECLDRYALTMTGIAILHTPADHAHVDALLCRGGKLWRAVEVKGREMTLQRLTDLGSLLISTSKIKRGIAISALGVHFDVLAHLSDDTVCVWRVSDDEGRKLFDYDLKNAITPRTCVDATPVTERCAMLPVARMRVIRVEDRPRPLVLPSPSRPRSNPVIPVGRQ